MGAINKVILIGNLGADPEVKTFDDGAKVATCSIATSESWKDKEGEKQEKTEWHRLVFWKGLAGVVEKFLKKGMPIYVEGKLQTRDYEKDGVKHFITEVVVRDMQMLGRKEDGQGGAVKPPMPPAENAPEDDDVPF